MEIFCHWAIIQNEELAGSKPPLGRKGRMSDSDPSDVAEARDTMFEGNMRAWINFVEPRISMPDM